MEIQLKEYIDARLRDLEKATDNTKASLELRLEGMNEFRNQLKDQNSTFITKNEFCAHKESIDRDIRELRESRAELRGKATQSSVTIFLAISVLGLLLGIINIIVVLFKLLS